MKTYSVKQIADMLETNPETVRRWIRDKKLKAVQVSRKDGNIVTEAELERFLKTTPKYLPRFTASLAVLSPMVGLGALAGGIVASALLGYYSEKGKVDIRVKPEDFKRYLSDDIERLGGVITQKEELIQQTQEEITNISRQIGQYKHLLEHEDLLVETLQKAIGVSDEGE